MRQITTEIANAHKDRVTPFEHRVLTVLALAPALIWPLALHAEIFFPPTTNSHFCGAGGYQLTLHPNENDLGKDGLGFLYRNCQVGDTISFAAKNNVDVAARICDFSKAIQQIDDTIVCVLAPIRYPR